MIFNFRASFLQFMHSRNFVHVILEQQFSSSSNRTTRGEKPLSLKNFFKQSHVSLADNANVHVLYAFQFCNRSSAFGGHFLSIRISYNRSIKKKNYKVDVVSNINLLFELLRCEHLTQTHNYIPFVKLGLAWGRFNIATFGRKSDWIMSLYFVNPSSLGAQTLFFHF